MSEDVFGAEARAAPLEISHADVICPLEIGAIMMDPTDDGIPVIGLHMKGVALAGGSEAQVLVLIDAERAAGTIAQLRLRIEQSGFSSAAFDAMVAEARLRLEQLQT